MGIPLSAPLFPGSKCITAGVFPSGREKPDASARDIVFHFP